MDNPQKDLALKIIESTDTHLFLTGRAGTGKTTFLRQLRKELPKRMVVLAPTGIAAINAEGVTIHSFFQLSFAPHVPGMNYAEKRSFAMSKQKIKLIQSIDLLVIDDLGTETLNSMKFTELYKIINTRLLSNKTKTIISTNLDLRGIFQTYDERLASRFVGYYDIYRFFGDDLRLRK